MKRLKINLFALCLLALCSCQSNQPKSLVSRAQRDAAITADGTTKINSIEVNEFKILLDCQVTNQS